MPADPSEASDSVIGHDCEAQIVERLRKSFIEVSGIPTADPVVRRSNRAHYQANGALALAKKVPGGKAPDLARAAIDLDPLSDLAESVDIAPQGFININVRPHVLDARMVELGADPRLGLRKVGNPERVVIDYSHPNVAKEMHVGHLRTTIIGDALARMLDECGHTTVRENHIGDWGTPFGMLIEHLLDVGEDAARSTLTVGDLGAFYKAARQKFDADETFAKRSRLRVVSLQGGDDESNRLWRSLVDQSIEYFQAVYAKLGVLLTPADVMGESAYNDMLAPVVAELERKAIAVESQGAICAFPAGFTNRDGEPLPLIVRKADGGYGYAATDLAAIKDRIGRLAADRVLYVVGAPQRDHLAMCFAVAVAAGWADEGRLVHVPFGSVLGSDGRPYKTRVGETVKLLDLLDEAEERALRIVREKSPHLSEEEQRRIAHSVGIGAVKYADLSVDRTKDYVFDWERMLSFDGNTAPYLQYARARAESVISRGGQTPDLRTFHLAHDAEVHLSLTVDAFSRSVNDALRSYAPHKLTSYLYDLAVAFAAFYERCPILGADTEEQRITRLNLTALFSRVMARGLGLLGIESPDRL